MYVSNTIFFVLGLAIWWGSTLAYGERLTVIEGEIATSEELGVDYFVTNQGSGNRVAALCDPYGVLFGEAGGVSRVYARRTDNVTSENVAIFEVEGRQAASFAFPVGGQLYQARAAGASGEGNLVGDNGQGNRSPTADADGDGIPNIDEITQGLDPATPDGHLDLDGDLMSNADEYIAGTRADDGASRLTVEGVQLRPNGNLRIRWQSVPGQAYLVRMAPRWPGPIEQSRLITAHPTASFTTIDFAPVSKAPVFLIQTR